jgi:histidine triad (HIT) family protein
MMMLLGLKKTDIIYRDEWVLANISPKLIPCNEGHVIVVPTKHYENLYDLPFEYGHRIFDMAQKIALALKKVRK